MSTENGSTGNEGAWDSAFSQARTEASSRKHKGVSRTKKNEQPDAEAKQLDEVAQQLMAPEYWASLVRAPADFMLAKTGRRLWNMSDKEAMMIAVPATLSIKSFVQIDPRWIAPILLLSNVAFIYGSRVIAELQALKAEQLDKIEKREVQP